MAGLGRNLNHFYPGRLCRADLGRNVFARGCATALHQGIGSESRYEFVRPFVIQYHRKIDRRQGRKNFRALGSRSNGTVWAFFFTRPSVVLNAND